MIRLGGNGEVPTLADANGREIPRKPQNKDFFAVILTSCQQLIHNRMGAVVARYTIYGFRPLIRRSKKAGLMPQ